MNKEILRLTASEISELVKSKKLSAREVCIAFLEKAEGDSHNSFIRLTPEIALKCADRVDKAVFDGNGNEMELAGVTVAVKDNICVAGIENTCASKFLMNFIPSYSAHAYEKMVNAGALLIGKANMDEFAMGSGNLSSQFGRTLNPFDREKVTGGYSGGSAAAVAAGCAAAALGSDTGGSARLPASYCGITAMKPTYGRISRYGLVAFASSFDQISPMTRGVRDNALLLQVISGHDMKDMTSLADDRCDFLSALTHGVCGMRAGMYIDLSCNKCVSDEVIKAFGYVIDNGAIGGEVLLPCCESALQAYYTLSSVEAFSNLARFDGIRYGLSGNDVEDSRSVGFGISVKERLAVGAAAFSYSDGICYKTALAVMQEIRSALERIFESCDFIVMPCSVGTAYSPGSDVKEYREDVFNIYANLSGFPAIAVPCGTDEAGMPIGVQLMADYGREEVLYRAAYVIEQRVNASGTGVI